MFAVKLGHIGDIGHVAAGCCGHGQALSRRWSTYL
jgi:hypothetical protein